MTPDHDRICHDVCVSVKVEAFIGTEYSKSR